MSEQVSVIFPVGPGARGAGLALDDLLGQTWRDLEIVAVLNGCPDEVARDLRGREDERLIVVDRGERPDLLGALKTALEKSTGSWLARMDSDDRCHPERIEKTLALLLQKKCEVASCGIELIDPLGAGMSRYVEWVNGLDDPQRLARERFIESPVVQPTVIMRREVFDDAGGYFDDGFAEDYSLWLRLLERGRVFGKVPERLYSWRDHEDRLTRNDERFSQKKMLALKARELARLSSVREMGVALSGAGPIAKVLARELSERGIGVRGFFEIDPKRIGSVCQGKPIVDHAEFGKRWREAIQLAAVGTPGGREMICKAARAAGFKEGSDVWCCC